MKKVLEDKTGYCLNQAQIEALPENERKERERQMELSREYLKDLGEEDEY